MKIIDFVPLFSDLFDIIETEDFLTLNGISEKYCIPKRSICVFLTFISLL